MRKQAKYRCWRINAYGTPEYDRDFNTRAALKRWVASARGWHEVVDREAKTITLWERGTKRGEAAPLEIIANACAADLLSAPKRGY